MTNDPFIIALQVWNGDIERGIELTRLIADIEPQLREDIEFAIIARRDTDRERVNEIVREAARAFKKVHIIFGKRFGTGHPHGPNDLWAECMMRLSKKAKDCETKATGVLTFEADCIPLRPDWLTLLREAWGRANEDGIECLGHAHRFSDSRSPRHINGNAIFGIHISEQDHHPELNGSEADTGWDVHHGPLLLQIGRDTDLIFQRYRIFRISTKEVADIRKNGNIPAMFHGIKTLDGVKAVRELMKTDEWRERAGAAIISKPNIKRQRNKVPGVPTFSISILAMNGLDMTKRCVESVLAHSSDFELLLTDNASNDGTREYFEQVSDRHPHKVKLFHYGRNTGFSQPNNIALGMAEGAYFITLNNDAEVPAGWMEKLEEPFLWDDNTAITGPEGSCCTWDHANSFHGVPGGRAEYIEGSCMCIRTDLARKHGLFADYIEFAYGEDCDLSLRMRAMGYGIFTVPFRIKHERSATSKRIPEIRAIQERNHHTMMKRWGPYLHLRRFNWPILVKRMGAIGDVLLTTPIIRALHEQQPESPIYVQTGTPEVFNGNPHIMDAQKTAPVIDNLQVIDLDMAYENRPGVNIVEAYFEASVMRSKNHLTEMFITPDDDVQKLGDGKWCAIHMTKTTWAGKNWSEKKWIELIRLLLGDKYQIVLVGNGAIEGEVPYDHSFINRTSIGQLSSIIRQCDLFIGHDSFPMHAAIASGCPTIGLFGISSSNIVLPNGCNAIGVDADPAHPMTGARHAQSGITMLECVDNPMETIQVSQVIEAVDKMLAKSSTSPQSK